MKLIVNFLVISCAFIMSTTLAQTSLEGVHNKILKEFEGIEHIHSKELVAMSINDVVLFDVRQHEEFLVSHIQGSIWLDPDMTLSQFSKEFKDQLKDKTIVFYCSVGWRSSKMASDVQRFVARSKAKATYNLTGGVFAWHNQGLPLVDQYSKDTTNIHPYNFFWGSLILDKKSIQYLPE